MASALNARRDANEEPHLSLVRVNLASVVYDAIETASPSVLSGGLRISVSLPPDSIFFAGDPGVLKKNLTNLLTDAAKFTAPGGHIYMSADESSEVVTFRVRDAAMLPAR
jgi:signal transduction histidine kinase